MYPQQSLIDVSPVLDVPPGVLRLETGTGGLFLIV
jgi:hypothetical protein